MAELVKKAWYKRKPYFTFQSGIIEQFSYTQYGIADGKPYQMSVDLEIYVFGEINGNEKIVPNEIYVLVHDDKPIHSDLKMQIISHYELRYPGCTIKVS